MIQEAVCTLLGTGAKETAKEVFSSTDEAMEYIVKQDVDCNAAETVLSL